MEDLDVKLNQRDIEGRFNWKNLLASNKIPLTISLLGLVLISVGIIFFLKLNQPEDKIEIISAETSSKQEEKQISADIEGAVIKPGVYQLTSGSRIDDLLVAAGGFSGEADRDWVEKNLNRAQKLTDGVKVYVPVKNEQGQAAEIKGNQGLGGVAGVQIVAKININTASASELDTLWGVGPATAQKIIDGRPYTQISDLLTKKILKSNVYQRIESQLTVY